MRKLRLAAVIGMLSVAMAASAADKLFDPTRDSAKDLHAAVEQAQREQKNILMDVGGNWCPWCILVDRTLAEDPELHTLLEKNYIVLRVNFSQENENVAFLSNYPKATGYPAWYVLSPSGKLLKAEDTSELEQTHQLGAGYNKDALKSFLTANAQVVSGSRATLQTKPAIAPPTRSSRW
jgi:thiol:disulfide interchange protein